MDTSIKIAQEDMILLNKLKNRLRAQDVKVTQKDLLHFAIESMLEQKEKIYSILESTKKDRKEATKEFFKGRRADFGDNWVNEINTTL